MTADGVLLGGLKIDDAVRQASAWWDRIGRFLMRRDFADVTTVVARYSRSAPGSITREKSKDHEAGNILGARSWAELNRDEKLQIVKAWHRHLWLPTVRPDLAPPKKPTWDELPKPPKPAARVH